MDGTQDRMNDEQDSVAQASAVEQRHKWLLDHDDTFYFSAANTDATDTEAYEKDTFVQPNNLLVVVAEWYVVCCS